MTQGNLETCPGCKYFVIERTTYCPHCGTQLTHPAWKRAGAWILLVLIGYALIRCNLRIMDGFDKF